jgi:hypothetical protein
MLQFGGLIAIACRFYLRDPYALFLASSMNMRHHDTLCVTNLILSDLSKMTRLNRMVASPASATTNNVTESLCMSQQTSRSSTSYASPFGLSDKAWSQAYGGLEPVTLRSALLAFLAHRAIRLYCALVILSTAIYLALGGAALGLAVAGAVSAVGYPIVEYVLHRYVLHATFLCRWKVTASLWRRLHYDHHMEPTDLSVLFADPRTSLALLLVLAGSAALVSQSSIWFWAMLATNCVMFLYYEFMHMTAHLPIRDGSTWLLERKRRHLRHHFVDERHDYGIGTGIVDALSRTKASAHAERSDTVRNLGYTGDLARRFPWVRRGYEAEN